MSAIWHIKTLKISFCPSKIGTQYPIQQRKVYNLEGSENSCNIFANNINVHQHSKRHLANSCRHFFWVFPLDEAVASWAVFCSRILVGQRGGNAFG